MKKKVTITAVVIICILLVAVALSANRAGGEIGFEATINSVENGVAYATINKQDAGFLAPKLPGNIEFNTSDLDVKLQAGDEISGCYLSGTINGSSVRVVDVTIKGNASQGINDLISLNEVSDYITAKGYTSKDFEESLMGRFREDIIRSWGASDLLFSGINADGWYLDDDKNRGISLTYDGDGYVCEVVIYGRFYMPAPWDNLSQSSQPRLPIPAVPPFCSPTHT